LGDIYCQRQHFKEALPLYELSIKIIKTHPSTWKNKAQPLMWTAAVTYARLGRNANAELLLKELLDYRPDHQEVYELLIQVLTAEHNQNETALYEKKLSVLKSKAHTP
jgi:tetratricopeptide (TPR) repeat protein